MDCGPLEFQIWIHGIIICGAHLELKVYKIFFFKWDIPIVLKC